MNTIITQKRFEKITDFNLVYLISFEKIRYSDMIFGNFLKRLEPEVIVKSLFSKKTMDNPEIPEKVSNFLKYNDVPVSNDGIIYKKVEENGVIYYDTYKNAVEIVSDILRIPEIRHAIGVITSLSRRSIFIKDLMSIPGFKTIETPYGNVELSFEELSKGDNKFRMCKLILTVDKDVIPFSVDLGVLTYSVYGKR